MADKLILMRHGKAVRAAEDALDMERRLTEAGERSLVAELPKAAALLKQCGSVQVWSSPAARAAQTALIMHEALEDAGVAVSSDILYNDALWTQDQDAFLEEARESDFDAIVAVGHNPFIEELCTRLCGSHVVFATGGFAAIGLNDPSGGNSVEPASTGRLLWFVQGPVSQRWKTLVQLEKVLAQSAETVRSRLDAFMEDPDDIETMHKFRVSIRTLRSLIAFVGPWQNARQNKACQADLKAIVGVTSRLRELDVLGEQAAELHGASPDLVAFCKDAAARERDDVKAVLASKQTAKRLKRVCDELENVEWRKRVVTEGLDAKVVRARFDGLVEDLEEELSVLDLADVEKTHDVRKNAKRVRYDAEKFKSLIGEDAVGIAKGMTAHQDNLGAVCDARVNIDIINGFAERDIPEPVAWDLALLRAQNETFLYTTLRGANAN